jgi:outer membrane cobalamin receptor
MARKIVLMCLAMVIFLILTNQLPSQSGSSNIAGTITESKSGEYVIGITVALYPADTALGTKPLRGAITNKFGFYSLPGIASGSYRLVVSGVGYEKFEKVITLTSGKDLTINIALKEKDVLTQDVIVEGERITNPTANIGKVEINPIMIGKMPSLGEVDVFRALQLLPGVKQSNELSSGLYVRGGSPDQNLTLLDGVIVYNPSHLGGFLSTFNSEALRDIKLIKGAFPAEYGGRLSSVLDMTMKEGTKEKISGSGGISLISAKALVEGPIGEDITFMISGRRMYLDILTGLAFSSDEDVPGYYFYDLNAKVNYKISENDRIFASGFFGRDVFDFDENDGGVNIFWGNKTGNLRWMHIISPTLFTNFSLIYTDYFFNTELIDDNSKQILKISSGINDITLRGDLQFFPSQEHTIKTGVEATFHNFKSYALSDFLDSEFDKLPENNIKAIDAAFFLQDEWKITPDLSTNLGCRLYYFDNGNYLNLEPRISASYAITGDVSVNAAFAVANQYLHLLVRNDVTLPTDLWFPSTDNVEPSRSMQGSLGMETRLFAGEYLFTTEIYYKDMNKILEYKDNADFNFGVPIEEQFVTGRGEAYGIEVFLNKRIGSFTGWIGYTLSWTKRHFAELNDGKWFYPRYDRRHDISVVLSFRASESWEISAAWVYGTGQAYTMPTGQYSFDDISSNYPYYFGNEKYQYTDRNGFRLPSYHRLDVNFIHSFEWFSLPFQFYISVYNVYNRKNPFAWYITSEWDSDSISPKKVLKQISLFPIIPTIGLNFKF